MRTGIPVAVAQVVDTLRVGGAERIAVELANGLAARGCASHVVATRSGGPLQSELARAVETFCPERRGRLDLAGARRIARFIDERAIDVVHTHNDGSAYLVRLVRRFSHRRPMHVVHDHRGPAIGNSLKGLTDWLLLRHVDAYIAATQPLRDRAERLLALPPERCLYVANGVSVPPPAPDFHGPPTIVQVANLHPPKAHAVAVRAAAHLRKAFPEVRWRCIGRKGESLEYTKQVEELIHTLDLIGCVELLGERDDVACLLREAHVGVLSSDAEALPLALLEYMAAGLPVVITDVGQGPMIVREAGAGSVVPPGDSDGLANAAIDLLRDPERARAMGSAAREYVRAHFSSETMVERIHALYTELAG